MIALNIVTHSPTNINESTKGDPLMMVMTLIFPYFNEKDDSEAFILVVPFF